VVGYGMLRGWSEGYDVPSFGVYVHPGERGRGVGASLLAWAVERARDRGATSIMLKVSPRNAAAVAIYRSRGFAFSGETMDSQLVGRLPIAPYE
jgi:ribosomal-protein-alanine N-acetyltransferase